MEEFLFKDIVLLCVWVVLFLASLPNRVVPLRLPTRLGSVKSDLQPVEEIGGYRPSGRRDSNEGATPRPI